MWKSTQSLLSLLVGRSRCLLEFESTFTCGHLSTSWNSSKYSKMASAKLGPAKRIEGMGESVWVEFIQLALEHKPLNLGQGFPDFAAPPNVTNSLVKATTSSNVLLHQYTRGFGHPRLVNVIAKFFSHLTGQSIDPQKEVLVTVGAYEALYCAIMGSVNPGDEVIIIEPFYDCYDPMVRMCGGTPVFVPLRPKNPGQTMSSSEWTLDPTELAKKFNSNTKAIVINTPNNPLGKVYTRAELEMIGALAKKHDVLVIMDEVYEWITFDGHEHIRMATLPGMWDRTVTIGSSGKTFSVTGWKLGWAYGPRHLIRNLQIVHQNCVYTCATPLQEAVAEGFELELQRLGKPESYFKELSTMLEAKRDKMASFLQGVGMAPVVPEGGYFMLADYSRLAEKIDLSSESADETKDYRFCKWLTKQQKLAGIPPTAFYSAPDKHLAENYIRFCFIKEDATLDKAEEILKRLKESVSL